MAVSFTLTDKARFPAGTSVGAYPVSNWEASQQNTPSGAPVGSATNTQTIASGTSGTTFTGLDSGSQYWLVGQVGSEYRYMRILAGADSQGPSAHSSTHVASGSDPLSGISMTQLNPTKTTYTQTYSTAAATNPDVTSSSVATTAATNSSPYGYSQAQADAIPVAINAVAADLLALKKLVNKIIDDMQANNLAS